MARIEVNGLQIGYEIIGNGPRNAILTPGGRFPKETPGIRELAEKLAQVGFRVVIWDRPNCGESDVCFTGPTESIGNADTLAGLLKALGFERTLLVGGSAGGRVSLLTTIRHPELVDSLFLFWLTGGILPALILAHHYYYESWAAAGKGGMEEVMALPIWQESIERNPRNRAILAGYDPQQFVRIMDLWAASFIPRPETPIPDVLPADMLQIKQPVTILRSSASDHSHPRAITDAVSSLIPGSQLLQPPWHDDEWQEIYHRSQSSSSGVCYNWPDLAPLIAELGRR